MKKPLMTIGLEEIDLMRHNGITERQIKKIVEVHSEQRHKFQKSYIDMLINETSVYELIEFFEDKTHMKLYGLTDKELIKLIDNSSSPTYPHISQWEEYIKFFKYVEGE